MREAIGGTWLFGLVITFIVFFASFLAVSINYSRAFNIKNEIVNIISKYEGDTPDSRKAIADYLNNSGYLVPGKCPESDEKGSYIGYDNKGDKVEGENSLSYFCIKKWSGNNSSIERAYYSAVIFFRIDLPIVGSLTTFSIKGETEPVFFPAS